MHFLTQRPIRHVFLDVQKIFFVSFSWISLSFYHTIYSLQKKKWPVDWQKSSETVFAVKNEGGKRIHKNNLLLSSTFLSSNSNIFICEIYSPHIIPPIIHKLRSFNHSNNHKTNETAGNGIVKSWNGEMTGELNWLVKRGRIDIYVCLTEYFYSPQCNKHLALCFRL